MNVAAIPDYLEQHTMMSIITYHET